MSVGSFVPLLWKTMDLVLSSLNLREAVGDWCWQKGTHREIGICPALPRKTSTPVQPSDRDCRLGAFRRTDPAVDKSVCDHDEGVIRLSSYFDSPIFTGL